jgi:two-component system, OmpR family, phosphate regulon response regulator PhoB
MICEGFNIVMMSLSLAMNKPRVLVVDDEKDLVRLVKYNLEQEGIEVFCAYNGEEALDLAYTKQPDVIILDLMLPDASGFKLCKELKALSQKQKTGAVRIIMLTARSAETDKLQGFESGTDDYVTKPFSPKELVWRVKSMLNRSSIGSSKTEGDKNVLKLANLTIDIESYRVWLAEEELKLTPIEFKILWVLAKQPNSVKTRDQLLSDVWENEADDILDRTVDAHVKRLRTKLGEARELIETVRGIGYRLNN